MSVTIRNFLPIWEGVTKPSPSMNSNAQEISVRSKSSGSDKYNKITHVKYSQVVLYALCILLSGDFFYWNNGLGYGIWIFLTAFLTVAISYFCFAICAAEINSCIPFAGGSYGFVRIAISPMLGYIIALCDRLHAGLLFARSLAMIGRIISIVSLLEHDGGKIWEPLYWLGGLAIVLLLFMKYKESIWQVTSIQTTVIVGLLIFFMIMSAMNADFQAHVSGFNEWIIIDSTGKVDVADSHGIKSFLRSIPMAMLFFDGLELIPCAGGCVTDPRGSIPRALFITYAIAAVIGLVLIFLVASNAPSMHSTVTWDMSLNMVWSNTLGLSESYTAIFSLLPFIGSLMASMYAIEKFSFSMNKSHFTMFSNWEHYFTRYMNSQQELYLLNLHGPALLSMISVYLMLLIAFYCSRQDFIWIISEFSLLTAIVVQIGVYFTYLKLHIQYSSLKRKFSFPYGQYAAYVGIAFNLLFLLAIVGYSSQRYYAGLAFAILLAYGACNYLTYVIRYQTFSDDEETILFVVHIVKANMDRQKRVLHHKIVATDRSTSVKLKFQKAVGKVVLQKAVVGKVLVANKARPGPSNGLSSDSHDALTDSLRISTQNISTTTAAAAEESTQRIPYRRHSLSSFTQTIREHEVLKVRAKTPPSMKKSPVTSTIKSIRIHPGMMMTGGEENRASSNSRRSSKMIQEPSITMTEYLDAGMDGDNSITMTQPRQPVVEEEHNPPHGLEDGPPQPLESTTSWRAPSLRHMLSTFTSSNRSTKTVKGNTTGPATTTTTTTTAVATANNNNNSAKFSVTSLGGYAMSSFDLESRRSDMDTAEPHQHQHQQLPHQQLQQLQEQEVQEQEEDARLLRRPQRRKSLNSHSFKRRIEELLSPISLFTTSTHPLSPTHLPQPAEDTLPTVNIDTLANKLSAKNVILQDYIRSTSVSGHGHVGEELDMNAFLDAAFQYADDYDPNSSQPFIPYVPTKTPKPSLTSTTTNQQPSRRSSLSTTMGNIFFRTSSNKPGVLSRQGTSGGGGGSGSPRSVHQPSGNGNTSSASGTTSSRITSMLKIPSYQSRSKPFLSTTTTTTTTTNAASASPTHTTGNTSGNTNGNANGNGNSNANSARILAGGNRVIANAIAREEKRQAEDAAGVGGGAEGDDNIVRDFYDFV